MTNAAYKFLVHTNTRVNYSFMQEKEACKQRSTAVEYMFLESQDKLAGEGEV